MQPSKGLNPPKTTHYGPKGSGSFESISSCQQNDIFSHISNPQRKLPLNDVRKDTQGSSDDEALRRIINQQSGSLYFLVKSGKFFVMMLVMPAHFFLLRVPRWMVVNMLPKIISFTQNTVSVCKENLNKLIQNIAKRAQVLVSLVDALKSFTAILKSSFGKLTENFLSPFKMMAEQVSHALQKTANFFSEKMESLGSLCASLFNFLSKAFDLAKKTEKMRTKPFVLTKYTQNMLSIFNENLNSFLEKMAQLQKAFQKARELAESLKENALKRLKPFADAAKNQAKRLMNGLDKAKQKLEEVISPKIEWVAQHIQKAFQVFNPPINFAVFLVTQMNAKVTHIYLKAKSLAIFKSEYATLKKMAVKMQSVQTAILKSFDRLRKEAFLLVKKMERKLNDLFSKAKHKMDGFKKKAKAALKILSNGIKLMSYSLLRFFKKLMRFFVLTYRWCRIMAKFTGYILREIFRELNSIKIN